MCCVMRVSLCDLRKHIEHIWEDTGISTFPVRTAVTARRPGPSHVTDSESESRAFHIPTVCILLFHATCLFRTTNNQTPAMPRHQQMNSDEVRVNISHVLRAEMINVEHTHTDTHFDSGNSLWLRSGPAQLGGNCGDSGSSVLEKPNYLVFSAKMSPSEHAPFMSSVPLLNTYLS